MKNCNFKILTASLFCSCILSCVSANATQKTNYNISYSSIEEKESEALYNGKNFKEPNSKTNAQSKLNAIFDMFDSFAKDLNNEITKINNLIEKINSKNNEKLKKEIDEVKSSYQKIR